MHFTVFQNVRFCFLLVHLETSLQTVENAFETGFHYSAKQMQCGWSSQSQGTFLGSMSVF